jgi:hypothetical protein
MGLNICGWIVSERRSEREEVEECLEEFVSSAVLFSFAYVRTSS